MSGGGGAASKKVSCVSRGTASNGQRLASSTVARCSALDTMQPQCTRADCSSVGSTRDGSTPVAKSSGPWTKWNHPIGFERYLQEVMQRGHCTTEPCDAACTVLSAIRLLARVGCAGAASGTVAALQQRPHPIAGKFELRQASQAAKSSGEVRPAEPMIMRLFSLQSVRDTTVGTRVESRHQSKDSGPFAPGSVDQQSCLDGGLSQRHNNTQGPAGFG